MALSIELSYLSPAAIQVLFAPKDRNIPQLLRLTYYDLLMRDILKLEKHTSELYSDRFISRGNQYDQKIAFAKPHELDCLEPFRQSPDLSLSVSEYERVLNNKKHHELDYVKKNFIKSELKPYFKKSLLGNWLKGKQELTLNDKGEKSQLEISVYLMEQQSILPERKTSSVTAELLKAVGSLAFFSDQFKEKDLYKLVGIHKELALPLSEDPELLNEFDTNEDDWDWETKGMDNEVSKGKVLFELNREPNEESE